MLKTHTPHYIHSTFRRLLLSSSVDPEEESSSFRNVECIYYGVCVLKTMEKLLLLASEVLLLLIYLTTRRHTEPQMSDR